MITYDDRVDLYRIDDGTTGQRMGRGQGRTLVAAGLACRVNERSLDSGDALAREETRHSHRVHFRGADPRLTTGHMLRYAPAGSTPLWLQVKGTRRPKSPSMPWVVYAQAQEDGTTG